MASITVQSHLVMERVLSIEIVRVTERAAVSAARLRGHGKDKASDQAAVDAMRRELNKLPIDGTVVIGEGELDEAPMLFIGEKVGNKSGAQVDIAVDPLEGTILCAKNMPGAIATLAMADAGTLLHAPDCYMQKIAIGPGYPKGTIDLDAPAEENILNLAKAKGVKPSEITAILLDRPRHAEAIALIRKVGAAVSLISDGYKTPEDAAAAFKDSGATAACICSFDAINATLAEPTAKALKAAGAKLVLMAGRPGDNEAALKTAGVDQFLFAGTDAVATLKALQEKLR